jgi:hypothetical protein
VIRPRLLQATRRTTRWPSGADVFGLLSDRASAHSRGATHVRVAACVPGGNAIGSGPPSLAIPISDRAASSSRSGRRHAARADGRAGLVSPVLGPDPDLVCPAALVCRRTGATRPAPGGALAACLARREFSGAVATTTRSSSGQGSGSKAKKPADDSNHGAHQSSRRTAPDATVTVHGRQVPAGPIRKPRARGRE